MTSSPIEQKTISVLDPDLPLLASEAAVDIDNIISNRGTELAAIESLTRMMSNSINLGPPNGSSKALMDPATTTVLGTAMAKVLGASQSLKLQDLLSEAAAIASELPEAVTKMDKDQLSKTRDFCIALSRAVMSYNGSFHDLRPSHPFRR